MNVQATQECDDYSVECKWIFHIRDCWWVKQNI